MQTLSKISGKNDAFRKFVQMSQNWLTLGKKILLLWEDGLQKRSNLEVNFASTLSRIGDVLIENASESDT